MNKFTLKCESILNDLLNEAHALLDYSFKQELHREILAANSLPNEARLEELKRLKRKLVKELLRINYKNLKAIFTIDREGKNVITDPRKYQEIVEFAVELLGSEDNLFRRLSKFSIAEEFEIEADIIE
jgi:hypothetical protein